MSTVFKLATFGLLLLATLSRVAAAQQQPVEKAIEVYVTCDDMRSTSSWNQRKRASSTALEQAIATVALASAPPSSFAPVSNVTFVATLRAPLSWGVNVEGSGWMTSSAVFRGTQLVNTSTAYPTEAIKAQYPAIGRNFTANLKALRVALFAYVKNCRIERMSMAV